MVVNDAGRRTIGRHMDTTSSRIVLLGGGGGVAGPIRSFVRGIPSGVSITIGVPTGDSGGSTGYERRIFSIPALGDIRHVLGALASEEVQELFTYRCTAYDSVERVLEMVQDMLRREWSSTRAINKKTLLASVRATTEALRTNRGSLSGHVVGSLLLCGMVAKPVYGGLGMQLDKAMHVVGRMVDIPANVHVMPASMIAHDMHMLDNGQRIFSEAAIDAWEMEDARTARVWLRPSYGEGLVRVYEPLAREIERANTVMLLPSSLYTSQADILRTWGIGRSITRHVSNGGAFIMTVNLAADRGTWIKAEQRHLTASEEIDVLTRLAGTEPSVVVYDGRTDVLSNNLMPLLFDAERFAEYYRYTNLVDAPLVSAQRVTFSASDTVACNGGRSRVVTSGSALAQVVFDNVLQRGYYKKSIQIYVSYAAR